MTFKISLRGKQIHMQIYLLRFPWQLFLFRLLFFPALFYLDRKGLNMCIPIVHLSDGLNSVPVDSIRNSYPMPYTI